MEPDNESDCCFTKKHSKYHKYLSKSINYPDRKTIKSVLNSVIPCKEALPSEQYFKLQENGYHVHESGYSIMPDGTGYIAFYIDFPDTRPDMFDWFFSWHPVETERYIIWNPEEHITAIVDDEDRLRLTNSAIPFNQRLWGVHVLYREKSEEDDVHDILVSYHSPYELGFSKDKSSTNWTAVCGNEGSVCFFVREKDGGSELRGRIWTGVNTQDAEDEFSLPGSYLDTADAEYFVKKTAVHYITDFSNLSSILPSLYKDYCTD